MTDDRCLNCGRMPHSHIDGRCPQLGLHLAVTAASLERYLQTGHPRTMGVLFGKVQTSAFAGIEVTKVRIEGKEVGT